MSALLLIPLNCYQVESMNWHKQVKLIWIYILAMSDLIFKPTYWKRTHAVSASKKTCLHRSWNAPREWLQRSSPLWRRKHIPSTFKVHFHPLPSTSIHFHPLPANSSAVLTVVCVAHHAHPSLEWPLPEWRLHHQNTVMIRRISMIWRHWWTVGSKIPNLVGERLSWARCLLKVGRKHHSSSFISSLYLFIIKRYVSWICHPFCHFNF